MTQTVVGLFDNSSDAQQAVQQLISSGFTNDNIDISTSSANTTAGSTNFDLDKDEHESGVSKFFKNLFGDDDNDADRYSKVASRGNSIVTVHAQSAEEAERAADILDDNGAVNVDEKASEYGYNSTSGAAPVGMFNETTGTSASTGDYGTTGNSSMGTNDATISGTGNYDVTGNTEDVNRSIPIIEENLEVGKRTVQTGGVRLRSRIVERPVEEELRLRQERVRIERNTVDRPATDADFNSFKEGEVEMIERAEVPVVSKQARVVEEVSLGKEVNERNETVRDTVRKTEVDVEDIEVNKNTSSTSSTDTNWTKGN